MLTDNIHDMKGHQFPFGVLTVNDNSSKIFVRKRYSLHNPEDHPLLIKKIDKLKNISHKNAINLRSADYHQDYVDLYYQYVPLTLEDSFQENPTQTVKELHRQFIELAIFLAKNSLITNFHASRCGIILKEGKSQVKYYLPFNEIHFETNRDLLERAVQLFNVQSMHHLDTINQSLHSMDTISQKTHSQKTLNKIIKNSPNKIIIDKFKNRKFSTNPMHQLQHRKLSSLSR
jgi:hypothetical protein